MANKLSPLAWVGIGCAGLALVGMIVAGVAVYMGASWVKGKAENFADEMNENPALASAKILAAANPDLDIVDSDKDAQTVTFKNNKTGETVTVNLEQIKEGKISFTNDEGTASLSAEEGSFTATGPDGQTTVWGAAAEHPDWAPAYTGTTPVGVASVNSQESLGGMFSMETPDAPDKVLTWYKGKLSDAGFSETSSTSTSADGGSMHIVSMRNEEKKQDVTLTVVTSAGESGTKISVNYSMTK